MIVYNNIIQRLADSGWSQYKLRKEKLIGSATIRRIKNNQSISTDTIDVICKLCNCQPSDLMKYVKEDE